VQVDPIKPRLKAPGTKRLKLKHDEPPSKLAFKFSLRRYSMGLVRSGDQVVGVHAIGQDSVMKVMDVP
jgi:hypothetical protein